MGTRTLGRYSAFLSGELPEDAFYTDPALRLQVRYPTLAPKPIRLSCMLAIANPLASPEMLKLWVPLVAQAGDPGRIDSAAIDAMWEKTKAVISSRRHPHTSTPRTVTQTLMQTTSQALLGPSEAEGRARFARWVSGFVTEPVRGTGAATRSIDTADARSILRDVLLGDEPGIRRTEGTPPTKSQPPRCAAPSDSHAAASARHPGSAFPAVSDRHHCTHLALPAQG